MLYMNSLLVLLIRVFDIDTIINCKFFNLFSVVFIKWIVFSDYFEMILNTVFIIWSALGTVSGNKVNLEQTFHFEITLMAP